ncbi:MAG: hypothetical protein HUJ63_11780 [Enterococcus sp.]|nr:hypothetical protein [Enterococcus sp.]
MTVFVVTGYTYVDDIHEDGEPQVFDNFEDAFALVKGEYDKWRKEYEQFLSKESLDSRQAEDDPPADGGAGFVCDDGTVFSWTIWEREVRFKPSGGEERKECLR